MLDRWLKRWFPAIVLAALALAAFFTASGVTDLVAASLRAEPPPSRLVAAPLASVRQAPEGRPILERNPFDSETGSLLGRKSPERDDEPPDLPPSAGGDPLSDPKCEFGRVVLITASDDPEWSFAAIELKSGGRKLHRIGDAVEQHEVRFIAWDRVWLENGGARCQMELGDKSVALPAGRNAPPPRTTPRGRGDRDARDDKLPPELAAKIKRVSDTQFDVDRTVVDEIMDKQAELMRRVRINPVKDGDKVTGLKLSRVKPGSLLDTLGLKDGDELRSINGFELSNPQKALEAYGRLRTADKLSLQVLRDGKPTNIEFNIQ